MTVRSRATERNAKIKEMLLACYPISHIARYTKLSQTRVRQIADYLVNSGELMKVPGSHPILYIDPRAHVIGTEFAKNDGGAEINGSVHDSSRVYDCLPPNGRLPLGMVNAHISGRISCTVRAKGTFADVKGSNGLYVGYWEKEGSGGKGKKHRRCHLSLFKQNLTVNFYESSKGTMELYINPGRVYYYPAKVKRSEVLDYIIARCNYVADLLKATGWQITEPQLPKNYQLHRAKEGDPLAAMIPPRYHDEGQIITSDTSPNYLETEVENASDEELVEIYANMPGAVQELKHASLSNADDISRMKAEIVGLKEVIQLQGESIVGLTANISSLVKAMTQMTTLQTSVATLQYTEFTGAGYR